jgi:hypothetical protein
MLIFFSSSRHVASIASSAQCPSLENTSVGYHVGEMVEKDQYPYIRFIGLHSREYE